MSKKQTKIKYIILLNVLLVIFSLGGICSKFASRYEFLSFGFIFFYGLVILNLGIYAIAWQQIIKHLPLNTAYSNKAITIIWGILWGFLFFNEPIKWNMIVGAIVVIIGVVMVVRADE